MATTDPRFIRPAPNVELGPQVLQPRPARLVEHIAYDVWFTDELIRRCRAHAARGYRLAATTVSSNKFEVTLVFESFEWNGVRFPDTPADDGHHPPVP